MTKISLKILYYLLLKYKNTFTYETSKMPLDVFIQYLERDLGIF